MIDKVFLMAMVNSSPQRMLFMVELCHRTGRHTGGFAMNCRFDHRFAAAHDSKESGELHLC